MASAFWATARHSFSAARLAISVRHDRVLLAHGGGAGDGGASDRLKHGAEADRERAGGDDRAAGTSSAYGMSGRGYVVAADGSVQVEPDDVEPLRRRGLRDWRPIA